MKHNVPALSYQPGDIIMQQGDPGDCAYIVESGRVEIVLIGENGQEQHLGVRGEGAMIGEMALIDRAPRSATIRAVETCKLLKITEEDFTQRLDKADPIIKMATQVILTRYRDTLVKTGMTKPKGSEIAAELLENEFSQELDAYETVKINNDFEEALKNNDITLFYQPIISFETSRICGFEALMRWKHPDEGFISPAVFIPVIEDSGFIIEASQWALKKALTDLKTIESFTGHDDYFMSVNFSSTDFSSDNFVENVYEILSTTDVAPQNLHLEVTERLLVGQPEKAKETLGMCQKAGMHISIDDFGTGYSSLSYLHCLPIDTLKIDQSFVKDMLKDDSVLALVKSMLDLSRNIGLSTIAEGIETLEDAQELKKLGCSMAQGYYFAKPMPLEDVVPFIQRSQAFDI